MRNLILSALCGILAGLMCLAAAAVVLVPVVIISGLRLTDLLHGRVKVVDFIVGIRNLANKSWGG